MDNSETELKKKLDSVPLQLKTKFAPLLREQFQKFGANGFLPDMKKIHEEFINAGGTDQQWNFLAPAVHYGNYDRIYPTPIPAV